MFKFLIILCIAIFTCVTGQKANVTQECLGCICEAASGCNTTLACVGDTCGAFRITWGYWADSGKFTLNGQANTEQNAYSNCANDVYCAARCVQGYMEKYAQDCNNDGVIDCDDYARIHYLGGHGCSGNLEQKYEKTYVTCRNHFH